MIGKHVYLRKTVQPFEPLALLRCSAKAHYADLCIIERTGCTSAVHRRDLRLWRFSRAWKAAAD